MLPTVQRLVFLFCIILATLSAPSTAWAAHAIAQGGTPKYGPDFQHFDYVNPDAPKGGTLYLANPDRRTSFDKFNPFTLKGIAPAGVAALMFETLLTGSDDEPASAYGLIAEDASVAADGRSVTFRINPRARFNDGSPVTATDVKFSFDTLKSKAAAPQYQIIFGELLRAVVLDAKTVRFDFASNNWELPLIAGSVPVFSQKWLGGKAFDQLTLEKPVTTGPYLIEQYDVGRNITFKRNPDYWAARLPSRRGMFNFDRIVYRMYKDDVARMEAFKAGEFDFNVEYSARSWVRSYIGPKFRSGEIVKKELPQSNIEGMQGFNFNLRRPLFKDVRVRQALGLAFDYEWMNRQLFYNQYKRIYSYWNNSTMAATAPADAAELKLLRSLPGKIDAAVFGPAPVQPSTDPPSSLRANLKKATALLKEAGWTYRDGALRNAKGEIFEFELIDDSGSLARVVSPFIRNLEKLGVRVNYRTMDHALYDKRVETFDFDMISLRFRGSQVPGTELKDQFSSKAADTEGSSNVWGLKDPAVDELLNRILLVRSRAQLEVAVRALDRILLNGYYTIPHWYSNTHRIAYRNRFGFPDKLPLYYQADAWLVSTAWELKPR